MQKSNFPGCKTKRRVFLGLIAMSIGEKVSAFELKYLHYRNETSSSSNGMDHQSLMGGAPIFISGQGGMESSPQANPILFTSQNIAGATFAGPKVSEDDAFSSNTSSQMLGYTVPAAWDIFKTSTKSYTYDSFDDATLPMAKSANNYLTFDVSLNTDPPVACSQQFKYCSIKYDNRYTPEMHDVVPNQVYYGQKISMMIDPKYCHSNNALTNGVYDPFYYVKIGKTLVDYEGIVDNNTRLNEWQPSSLVVNVGQNRPAKSADPDVSFTKYGRTYMRRNSQHCNWAGNECWRVRVHPKIDSISKASGYLNGGQTLVIKGYGLQGTTETVNVDGVACKVNKALSTDIELHCETGPKATASTTSKPQPGQPGISWTMTGVATSLATTLATANGASLVGKTHTYEGWFKAPETGEYRFFTAGDDVTTLYLDSTNPYQTGSVASTTLVEIAKMNSHYSYTEIIHRPPDANDSKGNYVSAWIQMTGGNYYKFKAVHYDGGGGYYFQSAVEFKKANTANHPLTTKAVQHLQITQTQVPEQWTLEILNPSSGEFKISFKSPKQTALWSSGRIKCDLNGNQMNSQLNNFFQSSKYTGSGTSTTLVMYDAQGVVTTDSSLSKKNIYTVKLMRRIEGFSFTQAIIATYGTISSTVTVKGPSQAGGIASSAPLKGNYILKCTDNSGISAQTIPRAYNEWDRGLQVSIEENIGFLRGKVRVMAYWNGSEADGWKTSYDDNGRSFFLIFDGLDYNPPKCVLITDPANPLTGNDPQFVSDIVRPYGGGIMFEPIGTEFLFSDAQSPQVTVVVDDLPAFCVGLNCDYAYVAATAQITAQAYDAGTKVITITGTTLPTSGLTLSFGGIACASSPAPTYTATQIQCTLAGKPRAGAHKAEIRDSNGILPYANSVADITIALVVSSVSPSAANALGGDTLTIAGSGFPIDKSFLEVTFDDGTACIVKTVTEIQITCEVIKMSSTNGTARKVVVKVNNVRYITNRRELQSTVPVTDDSVTLNQTTGLPTITAVDKTNVSPIIKQTLVFNVSNAYTNTLNKADLAVYIIGANSYRRQLYVMSVDNTSNAKKFTVKFNGAPVGSYTFEVTSSDAAYGRLDTSAITFQTSSTITGVSPRTGSVYGGTLLTITGTNFSTTLIDQAVNIIMSSTSTVLCDILTATTTQLTCRIRATGFKAAETAADKAVNVILQAATESTCPVQNNCLFSFVAPVATLTSLTPAFDAVTNTIQVTAAGTGFTAGNTASVTLYIDNVAQTTLSVATATAAVFTITNVTQAASTAVRVYFIDGYPTGWNANTSLTLTPGFVSVSPKTGGSEGGTLITVTGTGFGTKTTGLGLKNINTSADLCSKVTVTGYGTFTCLTKALPVASTDVIKISTGGADIACSNTTTTNCQFVQAKATSPTVTAASLANNVITFTGTDFPATVGYTAKAFFKTAEVAVTGWTTTGATATFTNGVPSAAASENAVPTLQFTKTADSVIYVTYSTGVTLTNTVTVQASDSTSGVVASFAGGLDYTVTKANIYQTLLETGNSITVCGNVCPLDATKSDATKAVCTLPPLATTHSASTYKIVEASTLSGTWTGSVPAEVTKVTDGNWISEYTDSNTNCFIELDFPDTQVGVLDSVKILMNNINTDKTPFNGVSKLQGFDGTNYVDIWTLDATIHTGWNEKEWTSSKPSYQKYKWTGATAGSCRFGEIKFIGIVAMNDSQTSTACVPKLNVAGVATDLSSVTYNATATPTITSITPRYGKVSGNETVTIVGTNFVNGSSTVLIDGKTCTTTAVTTTQITCTTSARAGDEPNPTFKVTVATKGLAATQGNTFKYVQYWSEASTWGNDAPPQFGEAVSIPKGRTLLVDVDSVPQLSFVLVEGSIIFAPNASASHQRTFDAGYIFINGGYMEVGTEAFPYTSKITITMHGDVSTPAIPTYGNKNISVRKGELHMVGNTIAKTWTMLESTADIGATQITVQSTDANWNVGDQIVIASTSFDHNEAETRYITAKTIVSTKHQFTLDKALQYKHYAATETYGSDTIDMRAEVGLLTRNVKYQGDPLTSPKNQYGAHIMFHYPEDESCIGRILYVEFFNVGQAFKLGRYPIHFHVIGTVAKSLVKGNAIHQTYNRGVTIHAVKYFQIRNNVIYNTMGHSIFVEDAIETKNVVDGNLVLGTRESWSLLNTDQTPASFWITHPDNIFTNNHAAGSARYGFWYDTQEHPINGSFTKDICPVNERLGEFRDNTTHSNGRYGLRIFHKLVPRTNPCAAWTYNNSDPSATGAPYPGNPSIPAKFYNLVGWKNGRSAAIGEEMGAVEWHNFKTADNLLSGMEWSFANSQVKAKDIMLIKGGLVIGKSGNTESVLDSANVRGIVGPRWDYFTVRDVKFYNLNFGTSGALGDMSHAFHPASTDSGARTYFTSGLFFDTTVPKRIWYSYPNRGIFYDIDGTLTGRGAGSWATAYFLHNEQPQCTKDLDKYDGLTCDNTVQVRRIVFHGMSPGNLKSMDLKIAKYDDTTMNALSATDKTAYEKNTANYGAVFYKEKLSPMFSWAVGFVTGHKYRMYWDIGQLDYSTMQIEVGQVWEAADQNVYFNIPYIGNYEAVDFFGKYGGNFGNDGTGSLFYATGSLTTTAASAQKAGMNTFDNTKKEIDFVINGHADSSRTIESDTVACRTNDAEWCKTLVVVTECTGAQLLWSDVATWAAADGSGSLPIAGQDVEIPSGKIIVFDLAESPIFNLVKIVGCLQFLSDNSKDQHLQAHQIYNQGGKFTIGSSSAAYTKQAKITLYGDYDSQVITMGGATSQGNKLIANVGDLKFYGKTRSNMSRLLEVAAKGSTTTKVETGLDWVAGEQLGFVATALQWEHSEYATITSYDKVTGALVLTKALTYYHFGAAATTGTNYQGLDMRGEVVLLTRNIKIVGDKTKHDWAGTFFTSDITLMDAAGTEVKFSGLTILHNVEFYNMGQYNNFKAALYFENSQRTTDLIAHSIEGCAIHSSVGMGIHITNSHNIGLKNNNIFGVTQIGVRLTTITNVVLDAVNVFHVQKRPIAKRDGIIDKESGVSFCAYIVGDKCTKSTYKNSIVAGAPFAGFIYPGYSCTDTVGSSTTHVMTGNVAHSNEGMGLQFNPDPAISSSSTCYQASDFKGYKNGQASVGTFMTSAETRFTNLVSVDNVKGVVMQLAGPADSEKKMKLKDAFVYGETADLAMDCPDGTSGTTGANCQCVAKFGVMSFQTANGGKDGDFHIPMASARPLYKIKAYATWNARGFLDNVNFINYKSEKTSCGEKQSALGFNPSAADYIPIHDLTGIKFTNVAYNAILYLYNPPQGWANVTDCGNFPCTAPSNVVYNFKDAVFEVPDGTTALPTFWTAGTTTKYSFQIVANFSTAAQSYPNSNLVSAWNAFMVADPTQANVVPQIGQLIWESLDGDTEDRSVQPVKITNATTGYENIINSYMDHMWDGFYTGQKRLSRFVAQVQTDKAYLMTYTGTPPNNMRYFLVSDAATKGITIKVPYPNAGSYSVKVGSNIVDPLAMDPTTSKPFLINTATATCGQNRYVGVENYLEFFITPGCTLLVIPRDAILTSVRMSWTSAEFFANDGVTTFTNRLASVLGVHPSRVKIVSVYEGSLTVDTQILDDPATQTIAANGTIEPSATSLSSMSTLAATLTTALSVGSTALGAPVLSVSAKVQTSAIVNTIAVASSIQEGGALGSFALGLTATLAALLATL